MPSTKYWLGRQQTTRQVDTLTVTASAVSGTITVTINGKDVVTTHTTTSTTTGATEVYTALAACTEPEFTELTFANPSNGVVTITGPDDGAPFTASKAQAGGSTCTLSTTTTAQSPHDFNDAENWSDGSVPGNLDTAVWENTDVDCLYNLSGLSSTTFNVVRRDTFTGQLGLPDYNPAGYWEYRATFLVTAGTTVTLEQAAGDTAGQIRVKPAAGSAVTAVVTGPGAGGTPGNEPIELTGMPASSTLSVTGAGVAVAPLTGQTCTVATLLAIDSTIRLGTGVTLTTANLTNCEALFRVGYTTLTLDRGGQVEVLGAGAGTTTQTDAGTILWRSSGNPGAVKVGSDGTFDASQAPAAFSVTSVEVTGSGWSYLDPANRSGNVAIDFTRCEVADGTLDLGTHYKLTRAAHS